MSKPPTRLEQLGNLLTAMIAVIVSGKTYLLCEAPPQPSPELAAKKAGV